MNAAEYFHVSVASEGFTMFEGYSNVFFGVKLTWIQIPALLL